MTNILRSFTSILSMVFALSSAALADTNAEINAAEMRFWNAVKSGSKVELDLILADTFNYQHTTGNTYNKSEIIDTFTSGKITVTSWGPLVITLKDYGDTVVSYGVAPVAGALAGANYSGQLRFVDVWHRSSANAAWRLTHRNSELLP